MMKHSGMWLHSRLKGYHDTCKSIYLGYSIEKNMTKTLSGKRCSWSTPSLMYNIFW